jgi:type VI secretion system protein ImpA
MLTGLQPYLPGAAADAGAISEIGGVEGEAAGGGVGIQISGAIRSRDDVVRALDGICRYYEQVEPGSPVPYLLRRAQKLAAMNFVEAMKELNLATIDTLRPSMGSTIDADAGAPPPSA